MEADGSLILIGEITVPSNPSRLAHVPRWTKYVQPRNEHDCCRDAATVDCKLRRLSGGYRLPGRNGCDESMIVILLHFPLP